MWKHQEATNLFTRLIVILLFAALLWDSALALSDKRLCADENCKEIISTGTGIINYRAGAEGMVSFQINSPIRIKSKSAGNDPSLWGIEVRGREGYAPKKYIRENRIFIPDKNLKYIVDVVQTSKEVPNLSTSEKSVQQDNSMETTTTKPLNEVPSEASEKPLEISTDAPATATPVLSEMVDGTPIPIFNNESDGKVENLQDLDDNIKKYPQEMELEEIEDDDEIGDYDEDDENELQFNHQTQKETKSAEIVTKNENKSSQNDHKPMEAQNSQDKLENNDKASKSSETLNKNSISENEDNLKGLEETSKNKTEENSAAILEIKEEPKPDDLLKQVEQPEVLQNVHNLYDNTSTEKDGSSEDLKHQGNDQNSEENIIKQEELEKTENKSEPRKLENIIDNLNAEQKQEEKYSTEDLQQNATDNQENIAVGTEVNSVENIDSLEEKSLSQEITNKDNLQTVNDQDLSTNNEILNDIKPELNEHISKVNLLLEKDELDQQQQELKIETSNNEISSEQLTTPMPLNIDNINSLSTDQVTNETKQTEQDNENSQATKELNKIGEKPLENQEIQAEANVVSQENVLENITPKPYSPYNNILQHTTPSPYDYTNQQVPTTNTPSYDYYQTHQTEDVTTESPQEQLNSFDGQTTVDHNNLPTMPSEIHSTESSHDNSYDYYTQETEDVTTESSHQHLNSYEETTTVAYDNTPKMPLEDSTQQLKREDEQPIALPSSSIPPPVEENKENKGLFATIMGTVNNVLSINKKVRNNEEDANELDRILFSNSNDQKVQGNEDENQQYCKKLGPNGECPYAEQNHQDLHHHAESVFNPPSSSKFTFDSDFNFDTFIKALASKILEISELLAFLMIVAAASLFFIFGYYCFCNSSREGALLSKLNQMESSLLATHKENAILKHNLMSTRHKLTSIEDNSFGSNDMVVSLKRELEEELMEKARLQEQITVLQKELENAADAGIELNKIVSELLSNQTGDESIISSVEELQKQLNEQQNTILEINASLAEKSRENSELQLLIAEQNARYESELANVQRDNDELEHEKGNLLTRLDELKNDFDKDITAALEGKNFEIKRLQNEIVDLTNKVENEHTKWQTSSAKIEALEECLKNVRKDPNVNITEVIAVANVKAQLIEIQKKYNGLKTRLESEMDSRKLAENQLQMVSEEVSKLKQDFNQSEKDKLEAQTRLEVLSNYFKDKENQLQKELSLKEAMWLKQQGETTTTVDRVTAMQEEIQSLKSQNDSLRAEIEAQIAAHKAQTGTLENRAHETWLAARQSDRRYEEARAEATALRRQLTAIAGGNVNEANKPSAGTAGLGNELNQAPSPIHMESPGSPMLGRMPPPPFLPPPFMGPPPPFMGMPPPPPFVPPGEMRPAPLGRIMSPPPQRSGRFSPPHLDYEDYLDYEGNNTWHRHSYSPPPRTYRSLSPTDSRYNYGTERDLMSTYDTETDFSPPPSPRESRRRGGHSSERIDNNTKNSYGNTKKFNSANKGPLSSGSEKSFNTPSHHDNKTKKGTSSGGGKNLV